MPSTENLRVAWLVPSAASGAHWEPIWSAFLNVFPNTTFYTTLVWREFDPDAPYASAVKVIGKFKPFLINRKAVGYKHGLMYLPLNIIGYLIKSKPEIIITNAFSIWSMIAVALKATLGWKVIILYEGSTPNSDSKDSPARSMTRKLMVPFVDAFIANNSGAKQYLSDYLKVDEAKIFHRSYLVPNQQSLLTDLNAYKPIPTDLKRPIFTFIGQLVARKGIQQLLKAASMLQAKGYREFSLLIIGDGTERETLQQQVKELGLEAQVLWMGRRAYGTLGFYLKQADVFVFPTLEDSWGMVVLEAMAFGKPILCSQRAGVSEMVSEEENGYLFDPLQPEQLAELMQQFIDQPQLTTAMGQCSQQLIAPHTPEAVTAFFKQVFEQLSHSKHA